MSRESKGKWKLAYHIVGDHTHGLLDDLEVMAAHLRV